LRARARLLDSPRAAEKLADFCALKGTYYVNGLASCMVGDELVHPFESHGYAKALSLNGDGTATFRARITETACAAVERERGRVVHRGVMSKGLGFPQNLVVPQDRDTANIALRAWPPAPDAPNRVLIASGDNGTPHALDPRTLETRGPLPECVTSMAALEGKRLLAHTRYDAQRGRLVFAATAVAVNGAFGGARSVLDFLEVDEKGEVVSHVTHETDFMVMHDWMITENYYVLPKCPAKLDYAGLGKFLVGIGRGVKVFELDVEQPASLLLIPRHAAAGLSPIEAKARTFYNIFHFCSCHERRTPTGARELVVAAVSFDDYTFGGEMGFDAERADFDPIGWSGGGDVSAPALDEFIVDLDSGEMRSRERLPVLCERTDGQPPIAVPFDMPTIHPLLDGREARFCYAAGAARIEGWFPFNSIVKADLLSRPVGAHVWFAPEHSMVSEPLFLPRGSGGGEWRGAEHEDDGFVVTVLHDAQHGRCELIVFDAARFDEGPFAAIDMGELYPWDVHASWLAGVSF